MTERTIPPDVLTNLDRGLGLSFGQSLHQIPAGQGRKTPQVYRLRWRLKKAQSVYWSIRQKDIHIFLPFILSIPPKACETFDVTQFDQHHSNRYKVSLSEDCKQLLENQAKKLGIEQNSQFKELITRLFNPGSWLAFSKFE